jgi:hypothetical protein
LNASDDLSDSLVIIGFQVLALGLGPLSDEEYRPIGGEEGIQDTMPTALALPRGRVGTANLPGTASSRDNRRRVGLRAISSSNARSSSSPSLKSAQSSVKDAISTK